VFEAAETNVGAGVVASELPRFRQAGWWAGKAFWAVLDQGLFATSNFILGILFARWLSPDQFGSFAVAQSVFLLAGTLHTGLFSEPMLVFGSARHATRFPAYLNILLRGHWRATGLGSLLLLCTAVACWGFASLALAGAFLGAAIASPFILFGWLVRRACLSRLQPQWAATGGAVYLLLLLTGSYAMWLVQFLSPFSAFILLGGAGLVSGLWILGRLRRENAPADTEVLSHREVLRDHWNYGRWAVASSGLSWVPGNLCYILLPAFAGLEAAGALRAVSNLVLPITHFHQALGSVLLPALSAAAPRRSQFNRLLAGSVAVFVGGSLIYAGLVTAFRVPIIAWLYHGAYTDTAAVVPVIAVLPIASALIAVLGSAVRALERPQQVFWAYAASTAVTVTVGIWCMARWGLTGAALSLLLSSTVTVVICAAFLVGSRREGVKWA
jgi:O-antigen/teichoic acid export membrane protein